MPHLDGCHERGLLIIEGENVSWKFGKICIDSKDLGKELIMLREERCFSYYILSYEKLHLLCVFF
jgi:hypothetical protein